jgi:hypothetical protein
MSDLDTFNVLPDESVEANTVIASVRQPAPGRGNRS